jgi:hypothetical protein
MAQAKSKTSAKKPDTATELHNALPFYVSRKKSPTPWWNVKPSGNYTADLETGRAYAKAFIPLLTFNLGAAALGWIVSDMARAARPAKRSDYPNARIHSIDAIATGFMLAIGGSRAIGAGGAVAAGAGGVQLQNGNGVILQLSGPKVGAEVSAAVGGVTVRLK